MKKNLLSLLTFLSLVVVSQLISCGPNPPVDDKDPVFEPVRSNETEHSRYADIRYRLNEIIIMFKNQPNTASVNQIKAAIQAAGIDPATITVRKCNSCDSYVELWHADNLHTLIQSEGLRAGTVSDKGSQGVGEDGLAHYSLNFMQNIPMDTLANFQDFNYGGRKPVEYNTQGKDVIRIAVLDTGIDTDRIISTNYRWSNEREVARGSGLGKDDDHNCYIDDVYGWNFIAENNDIKDDHRNLHGTLISQYIVNEFAASRNNAVQIMTLKTHDKEGYGDLFSSICAIHYAMQKGANIINASWGFYYYKDGPHPYLDSLITQVLRKKGILFVTAAGNKIDAVDDFARNAYRAAHGGAVIPDSLLRNLEYHNFYPACLSDESNNVVTVTTADDTRVSPTQNYSSKYVDMGVTPDDVTANAMKFKVPFAGPVTFISGSSFATAIATGKIGSFFPLSSYAPDISKSVVLDKVEGTSAALGIPALITRSTALQPRRIRNGRLTSHN